MQTFCFSLITRMFYTFLYVFWPMMAYLQSKTTNYGTQKLESSCMLPILDEVFACFFFGFVFYVREFLIFLPNLGRGFDGERVSRLVGGFCFYIKILHRLGL